MSNVGEVLMGRRSFFPQFKIALQSVISPKVNGRYVVSHLHLPVSNTAAAFSTSCSWGSNDRLTLE